MNAIRSFFILFISLLNFACSTTPAPVIDRLPQGKSNKSQTTPTLQKVGTDWRPASYTVKKGDTLYSIGLEHGYDYKDIAQANNISAPYIIKIGQTLKFSTLNEASANADASPAKDNGNGVVTYPIGNESPQETRSTTAPIITTPPTSVAINEPKALREPYSDEAYKKPPPTARATPTAQSVTSDTAKKPIAEKPSIEPKPEAKTAEPKVESTPKLEPISQLSWIWPTKGKVIANFNDAGNKGIDISGKMGQAIHAAAPGKVIYSGSDLRGYGKLVIVKHSATYLSVYANNSLIIVKEGQQVSSGQKIAEMGDTDSNTVKLHFEIRQQGKSVDPMKFLSAN
ncbi:MAG: peptidoglycan DD-metalloendopeptidase family protein [Methylotenera sp.]|uniref:peptidoglycan DD-metalloendopeptidase family protein n=1 Tax=Methylotenera sp. TaxID=2051956 RepID=UPI00271BC0D9|nr:peptidoglycan DD-metalloendopeptidase family protein [Methylotenera sp.]MDO9150907.1 peptidoglycan DD-metalloendopeptidase family protein [Methylotenera sp.]